MSSASGPGAAIDIGTQSVRLLMVDANGQEVARIMRMTRLGEGVDGSRTLAKSAMDRTLIALEEFAVLLRQHGVTSLRMTATSAARDAKNREQFFEQVERVFGKVPELLSGAEEARLSFVGATTDLPPLSRIVFDIGGGSTEFAAGTTTPERFVSVDVGCLRITERFLTSDPPTRDQVRHATEHVRNVLTSTEQKLKPDGHETWMGLAGTVSAFAARVIGLRDYDANATHGTTITREAIHAFTKQLCETSIEARATLLAEPKRASVIAGGAIVLAAIVDHFQVSKIVSSERDILDGLVHSSRLR